MALIRKAKGRSDGGYTRLLGDQNLGHLISQIQAAVITAGTELEKLVIKECQTKGILIADLYEFLYRSIQQQGAFVASKKVVKASSYAFKKEPDFLVFIHRDGLKHCMIIELKDGDNFDTKKAAGEVKTLKEFETHIAAKIPYTTAKFICCFNASTRAKVVEAFKHAITEEEAMTGKEFCDLLGLDYESIVKQRMSDQHDNLKYFVEELRRIDAVSVLPEGELTDSG